MTYTMDISDYCANICHVEISDINRPDINSAYTYLTFKQQKFYPILVKIIMSHLRLIKFKEFENLSITIKQLSHCFS